MQVTINGEIKDVEVNREIVPRAQHSRNSLQQGDVVEIVTFVGGG